MRWAVLEVINWHNRRITVELMEAILGRIAQILEIYLQSQFIKITVKAKIMLGKSWIMFLRILQTLTKWMRNTQRRWSLIYVIIWITQMMRMPATIIIRSNSSSLLHLQSTIDLDGVLRVTIWICSIFSPNSVCFKEVSAAPKEVLLNHLKNQIFHILKITAIIMH